MDTNQILVYSVAVIFILCAIYLWSRAYSIGKKTSLYKSTFSSNVLKGIPEVKSADRYKYGYYLSGSTAIVLGLLLIIFMPDIFDKSDDKHQKNVVMT